METLDGFVNAFLVSGPQDFGFGTLLIAMSLSTLAGCLIATIFYQRYRHRSDATLFAISIILFGLFCCVITLVVGSNIARAFGLIGALSIIRFRNTVKSIEDMMFLFWTLTIGMCIGAGFYTLGMTFTLFSILIYAVIVKLLFFERSNIASHLVVKIDALSFDAATKKFEQLLKSNRIIFSKDQGLSSMMFNDKTIRVFYNLKIPTSVNIQTLDEEMRSVPELSIEDPPSFAKLQV